MNYGGLIRRDLEKMSYRDLHRAIERARSKWRWWNITKEARDVADFNRAMIKTGS